MEDHRRALKTGTVLEAGSRDEHMKFVIEGELGRGGSCIVYEASRTTDKGVKSLYRIKELYPYKLDILRDKDGSLIPSLNSIEDFQSEKLKFWRSYTNTNYLFYSGDNYSSMTNQMFYFKINGTCYIVSAYSSRKTLGAYKPCSLKEAVMLMIQVAYIIDNIHNKGYLYLDIKPDNVLIVDGYKKQIKLFDFDSLFYMENKEQIEKGEPEQFRISYSKGFSAIELQCGNIRELGRHTDVYGVGALLFFVLFGKTPQAPDCELYAEYNFHQMNFDHKKCDDRLFSALSEFFHKTLAVFYGDRYQSMKEVMPKLQEIEQYSDTSVPRIYSTPHYQMACPKIFYGRGDELERLDEILKKQDYSCIFITGMGGIGKSSFVRRYLGSHAKQFDTILFVDYKDSIEETIADDRNIKINTLRQEESGSSVQDYFFKKIEKLRELISDKKAILVIDNYTGEPDEGLRVLLSTGIKLILISRRSAAYQSREEIKIEAISDRRALLYMFEENLGRPIRNEELDGFNQIIEMTQAHTLALELIAKQIASSHISIQDASRLTDELGFSSIAPEKIVFEKDSIRTRTKIGSIIDALFEADELSKEKKNIMKILSLTGDRGIDINELQKRLELETKDDINELTDDGWITLKGDLVLLHHVICEAVHRWMWGENNIASAERFLNSLCEEIGFEAEINDYPLAMRKNEDGFYDRPADIERLQMRVLQSEEILKQCRREKEIKKSQAYIRLSYVTLLNAPVYQEDYILKGARELFAENRNIVQMTESGEEKRRLEEWHMKLYASAALILADNRKFEESRRLIKQALFFARQINRDKIYALYYNLLGEYYDIRLNGAYEPRNKEERILLKKMMNADERTLRYAKKDISQDMDHLYVKNLIGKAVIQIRSGQGSPAKIKSMLLRAMKLIEENTGRYAVVRLHAFLACARYFSIVKKDLYGAKMCLNKAWRLSESITATDMQQIENLIIPSANTYYELGEYRTAVHILRYGIKLCDKYQNSDVYARLKQEMQDFINDVEDCAVPKPNEKNAVID